MSESFNLKPGESIKLEATFWVYDNNPDRKWYHIWKPWWIKREMTDKEMQNIYDSYRNKYPEWFEDIK